MLGSLAGLKLGGIKRGTREKNKGEGQGGGARGRGKGEEQGGGARGGARGRGKGEGQGEGQRGGAKGRSKGEGQGGGARGTARGRGKGEAAVKLYKNLYKNLPLYTVLAGGVTLTPQTRQCLLVVVFAALAGSFVERTPTHTRSRECGGGGWGSGCDSRRGSRLLQKLEIIIWTMQCINGLLTGSRWTPSLLATAL